MTSERWAPVPSLEGVEASDLGRIRVDDRILKPWASGDHYAYRTVYVPASITGCSYFSQKLVHRLVAEAFLGPCPDGWQVDHLDANPSNNALANLEYVTPKENTRRARRHQRELREQQAV